RDTVNRPFLDFGLNPEISLVIREESKGLTWP
ncbi:MAG: hypothetical protein RI937_365, partial [Pseudomonadota bacterium]